MFKRELPFALEQMEIAGYETSAHATTGEGDAIEAAKKATERGFDLIIAVGGDGTINEVINGMAGYEKRPKLGIIPVGTTNDFARALHISRDIKKAVQIITEGKSKLLDIGKVNDHYFINIAGGGELTELTYEVPSRLKTVLGQAAYFMKGMEMLPFLKPVHTKIEFDGETIDENIMLFLVSNTNSVGGFEKLAPDAELDDGYFDLIILKETNMAEFIRIATLAIRGAHIEDKHVIYKQAKHIKVTPEQDMQLNIDGEYGGMLPGEFTNLKQHIEFFVPDKFLENEDN